VALALQDEDPAVIHAAFGLHGDDGSGDSAAIYRQRCGNARIGYCNILFGIRSPPI
jgi:hypothetical protein